MRIALVDKNVCVIYHSNGDTISWDVKAFDKTKFSEVDDPFREINGYWAWLKPPVRNRIWTCYLELRRLITAATDVSTHMMDDDPVDIYKLIAQCSDIIATMYTAMPLPEIDHWLGFHGNVVYPDNLAAAHSTDDRTPDGTYLLQDYQGLVVLATALRPMVPIWGEFINLVVKEAGTNYKEFIAIRLLCKTEIVASEPVNRLLRYLESRITKDVDTSSAVLADMSTAEIPEWLLAMVMVRRLAIGSINASLEKGSIISNIYVFVFNTLKDLDKKFGGVREKYPIDSDKEEEGSQLESYRVKQTLTIGDTATFNIYTEDPWAMAVGVDASITVDVFHACIERMDTLYQLDIQNPHINLAQWVMASVMSPHAIPCLDKPSLLRVLCTVQALLWHWGFHELALLITARCRPPAQDEFTIGSAARVSNDLIEQLNQYYPYSNTQEPRNAKKSSIAYLAIMTLTKDVNTRVWTVNAPTTLVTQCRAAIERGNRLIVPPTMAEQLTRLVIKLNQLRGD